MFRSNPGLLLALQATRTRFVQIPGRTKNLELKKFSTMGSACTFPVESLIFLSIAIASVLTKRQVRPTLQNISDLAGQVAVFGDDIVIPSDSRELMFEALEVLHFKVNVSKSYWTGKFRESCGVDAYAGVDVTPAYWRSANTGKPDSVASTVSVRNNFYQKFFLHTAAYLASTIRGVGIPNVSMESGVMGFKTRVGPIVNRCKTRYNRDLQRSESLVPMLLASVKKTPTHDDTALLQYFTEDPSPFIKWSHGVTQRPSSLLRRRWVASDSLVAQ
jgi:hypothetical protein